MGLDELRTTWASLNKPLPHACRPHRPLRRSARFQRIGAFGTLGIAAFILWRFRGLDNPFFKVCGVLSIVCLIAMALVSWQNLRAFDFQVSYRAFSLARIRFQRMQKVNVVLSMV